MTEEFWAGLIIGVLASGAYLWVAHVLPLGRRVRHLEWMFGQRNGPPQDVINVVQKSKKRRSMWDD